MSKTIIFLERTNDVESYLRDIRAYKVMDAEGNKKAFERLANGDESARDEIILGNLRVIVNIAKTFDTKGKLLDFIQVGNDALISAVDCYDNTRENGFLSYLKPFVCRAIMEYIRTTKLVRTPNDKLIGAKVADIKKSFFKENERDATSEEIADLLKDKHGIKVSSLEVCGANFTSINDAVNSDDDESSAEECGEFAVASACENEYEREVDAEHNKAMVASFLRRLNAKELQVITLAFGLNGDGGWTDDAIAEEMGLTNERVRQLKKGAISKMHAKYEESVRQSL